MIEFNGKQLCENCFEEINTPFCTHCGYNPAVTSGDPTMLRPGSILLGKYIVGKVMGKGGFGVTYLAYDVTMGKKVAIKEFFPYGVALRAPGTTTVSVSTMENANAFKLGAEKFYNEAQLVSRFNGNPNIVGVYEFFYENDTVYFAMEYLKGHTLKEHIEQTGPLTSEQGLFVMQNVANALMAAHSSNVLHRDISPDNIIVCDNGDIKLIDFGAARQVVAEHSQSFSVILKPGFAPLEQYQKKGNQGPWTDIYSLGATIYYAITTDILEDPMSRMDDDEEFKSNQYSVVPELWDVITRATELKIENRYGDVFQLKNDLAKIAFEAQPLVVPNEPENKMPEFQTAMPFGMTQHAGSQPAVQPVGVGAPAQMPAFTPVQMQQPPTPAAVQSPTPAPVQAPVQAQAPVQPQAPAPQAQQPAPNIAGAPAKKRSKGKTAVICAALAAVVAAAVIIPVAVNANKDNAHFFGVASPTVSRQIEDADNTANSIELAINDYLSGIETYGCALKSGYFDVITVEVDSDGRWNVYGIAPDHFTVRGEYYFSASVSSVDSSTERSKDQTRNLALELAKKFPYIINTAIIAVLDNGQCTFVAYGTSDEIAVGRSSDWTSIKNMISSAEKVPSSYEWNGKTAGVTSSGLVVGTSPKVGLSR